MPEGQDNSPRDPENLIEEAAVIYAYRLAEEPGLAVDEFCAEYPESIRAELKTRCEATRRVQDALIHGGGESPGSDEGADQQPARARRAAASGQELRRTPGGPLPSDEQPAEGADPAGVGDRSAAGRGPYRDIGGYRVLHELGRGAMGVVYLAEASDDQRRVALKVLGLNPAVAVRTVERFRREMTAASKLHHSGIVEVLEVGEDDGLLFMVMEYVEGEPLEQVLERARRARQMGESVELPSRESGPAGGTIARAADIVAQVAEALQHAHGEGIIHRDVKPGNVIIDSTGRPRLLDFGLAKDLSEVSISSPGDLAGTPCYMSPEQAMSKRVRVDHRSDVFSLGVVLYEMLALRRPFGGDTLQRLFFEISFKEPDPLQRLRNEIPRDLATICEKAMSKNPDHRFQSAGEMALDLRRFLNHESILARPVGALQRSLRRARRQPALLGMGALLALFVLGLPFGLSAWGRRERVLFAQERVATYVDAEPYGLREVNRALASLRAEQALRALAPDPESGAGQDLITLERKRIELADKMDAFISAVDDPSQSYLSAEVQHSRLANYRFLTPILRSGTYDSAFLRDASIARLSVTSDPPGATVYLEALRREDDARLGRLRLGETPLEAESFEPGRYRIVLEIEDFGTAEYTRAFEQPGELYELECIVRRDSEATRGMKLLVDDEFVFGSGPEEGNWPMHERRTRVGAMYVDPDEVTCAEYNEFVLAAGARRPTLWPDELSSAWLERPVVGVSRKEAQTYAEWAGKRLPTMREWQRLSRGKDGNDYPRGEADLEADADAARYVLYREPEGDDELPEGIEGLSAEELERVREAFLARVQPRGAGAAGRTPEGFDHTLGNVSEWTETFFPDRNTQGRVVTNNGQACLAGANWLMRNWSLSNVRYGPPQLRDVSIGFRCVKSALHETP